MSQALGEVLGILRYGKVGTTKVLREDTGPGSVEACIRGLGVNSGLWQGTELSLDGSNEGSELEECLRDGKWQQWTSWLSQSLKEPLWTNWRQLHPALPNWAGFSGQGHLQPLPQGLPGNVGGVKRTVMSSPVEPSGVRANGIAVRILQVPGRLL